MSIIEKLGIKTPDEIEVLVDVLKVYELAGLARPCISDLLFEHGEHLKKILDERNKMLEALIGVVLSTEKHNAVDWSEIDIDHAEYISIIEKACYPKTWEEIKEMLNTKGEN